MKSRPAHGVIEEKKALLFWKKRRPARGSKKLLLN
jgi:hypothetical protein